MKDLLSNTDDVKIEAIKKELLRRAIESFGSCVDDEEIYYTLAFDCNSCYTKHIFALNTKESFEGTLESHQKLYPETYYIPEEIEKLKYSSGDWKYPTIDSPNYKALDESFIGNYEDADLGCEDFMKLACETLLDFMETDVFKQLPKANDFKAICRDHSESIEKAEERMRVISYFYKKQNNTELLKDQEAVITVEEAKERGYEISEEMESKTMIFFNPNCVTDYDTMKYIKKQWSRIGRENSYNGGKRCRVLLIHGIYYIKYADWVINSKDLKQECGIFLFDGKNKPVILYGEIDALGIGLICTKKWPKSSAEFESLRKHFLEKDSRERSTDPAWVEAECKEDYFEDLINMSYSAWNEEEAEVELKDFDEDDKIRFVTTRLLLKYFAEKRGDLPLMEKWDQQIENINKNDTETELTSKYTEKHQIYMKAYNSEKDKEKGSTGYVIEVFNVDIDDKHHVIAAIKKAEEKLREEKMVKDLDHGGQFPIFGKVENEILIEIYSSEDVYHKAATYEEARPVLKKLCDRIIKINHSHSGCPMWEDEELLFGVSPAFALALADKNYIDTAIDMMCSMCNGDHTTPDEYSRELFEKWGPCAETIKYLAASLTSMPMQEMGVQADAAMEIDGYKEYLEDENNIDTFLNYYTGYLKNSHHYEYITCNRDHVEGEVFDGFQYLFLDKSDEELREASVKLVDLLPEGTIPTSQLIF